VPPGIWFAKDLLKHDLASNVRAGDDPKEKQQKLANEEAQAQQEKSLGRDHPINTAVTTTTRWPPTDFLLEPTNVDEKRQISAVRKAVPNPPEMPPRFVAVDAPQVVVAPPARIAVVRTQLSSKAKSWTPTEAQEKLAAGPPLWDADESALTAMAAAAEAKADECTYLRQKNEAEAKAAADAKASNLWATSQRTVPPLPTSKWLSRGAVNQKRRFRRETSFPNEHKLVTVCLADVLPTSVTDIPKPRMQDSFALQIDKGNKMFKGVDQPFPVQAKASRACKETSREMQGRQGATLAGPPGLTVPSWLQGCEHVDSMDHTQDSLDFIRQHQRAGDASSLFYVQDALKIPKAASGVTDFNRFLQERAGHERPPPPHRLLGGYI
jgi:hypothetical protein